MKTPADGSRRFRAAVATKPWWRPDRHAWIQILLITAGHLLLLWWALQLVMPETGIPLIWLPDGYLLACLVLAPLRRWPALLVVIAASVFSVEVLMTDRPPIAILWFLLANLLESTAGALLFRRFAGGREGCRSFAQLSAFIGLCVLLVPTLTSAIGAWAAVRHGVASHFSDAYFHWYSAVVLGILLVAPLTIKLARWWREGGSRHWRDGRALLAALIAMAVLVILSVRLSALGVGYFSADMGDATGAMVGLEVCLAAIVLATLLVSVENTSSQRGVKQELALNKTLLEELFNTLAAGVVVHAPDTQIVLSNRSADVMLGLTHDEMLARNAFDPRWEFFDSDGHPLAVDALPVNQILKSGEPLRHFIVGLKRPDPPDADALVWVLVDGAPLFDATGAISRVLVSFLDITELRRAEQRLRESAAVFASTSEGVTITDLDGTIRDVNQAFCAITGYSREEVIGQNPRILQSGRHDREYYRLMWQSLIQTGQWRGEIWNRRKNGSVYPELLTISAVRNSSGDATGYVAVFSDISSLKQSEELLHHLAHHDPLTGLPNRLLLIDRLEQSIKHAERLRTMLAVGFIDLDRFKHVNDSLGHGLGDQLLQEIAERIVATIRGSDTVGRIGGDEFLILLEDLGDADQASMAIEKLMKVFARPFSIGGHEVYMTASIGLSLYPSDGREPATLLRNADAAMYRAKDEGRNTYQFYSTELTQAAFEHLFLESALRNALSAGEMHLVYQPQVSLGTGAFTGMEALLRWRHPQQGMISPARFIPIAEQSGLIRDIGTWVLETACRQGRTWLDQGMKFERIAVNVAGPQLIDEHFHTLVERILEKTGLPPCHLALEVTESFVMRRLGVSIDHLNALRASGIEIAIDDFGTGYSSLSYLKKLPIDKLKIDSSFVRDIPQDSNDAAITEAIIALARALNMKVIAEGVETEEQAQFLQAHGCPEAQGYLYSQPLAADEIPVWKGREKA